MTDIVAARDGAGASADTQVLREAARGPLALLFPAQWLDEHAVLPLAQDGDRVTVAAAAPLSPAVTHTLQRRLGVPCVEVPCPATAIRAAIAAAPRTPASSTSAQAARAPWGGDVTESLDDLRALASREPVIQVVNALLSDAVRSGASDVHFESVADGVRVRMRRDGVLHDVQHLGASLHAGVLSRVKVLAGLDIAERRIPQDGRARVEVAGRALDIRVSTVPALHGESLVLRVLDSGLDGVRPLSALGIADATCDHWTRLLARTSGLLLVTGPTGSGKTTTLYASLAARSGPDVKVLTVEDPVEYRLDGVVQLPVNPKAGFDFPNALRAMLRHDPDVMLVGELRDAETAEMAVQAALTGHLVLSTLHTIDATGALARLTEMGVAPYLIAATLQAVLAQRLVRRPCDACATWQPLPSAIASAVPDIATHRAGAGCIACAHTGYRGRTALTELLVVDAPLRAAFLTGASVDQLRTQVRASGVASLEADGWRAVRDGRTTADEVLRLRGDLTDP